MTMPEVGILDTSVVIDLRRVDEQLLPDQSAITSVTLAELAAGPQAATDALERSARQERLQWVEATFDAIPFDTDAARAYGRIYALVRGTGRQPRRRLADLLIAAVASAHQLPLYTRNPADFAGLEPTIVLKAV